MDYEKKYKEALERASKLRVQNPFDTVSQMMEHVFPELKESEDEKIRKELIEFVKSRLAGFPQCEKFIAWLEEHANFRNKIQIGDKVTRNEDGVLVNMSQLKRVAKKDEKYGETFTKKDVDDAYLKGISDAKQELEKQGENSIYYFPSREVILAIWDLGNEWKELTNGSISTEYGTQLAYIQKHWEESEYYLKEKQDEQKPAAWSENDEYVIERLFCLLNNEQENYPQLSCDFQEIQEFKNWLKSLKDKVQPKQ